MGDVGHSIIELYFFVINFTELLELQTNFRVLSNINVYGIGIWENYSRGIF